jgi:hypothetical protein
MLSVTIPELGSAEVQGKSDADLVKVINDGKGKMKPVKTLSAAPEDVAAFVRTLKKQRSLIAFQEQRLDPMPRRMHGGSPPGAAFPCPHREHRKSSPTGRRSFPEAGTGCERCVKYAAAAKRPYLVTRQRPFGPGDLHKLATELNGPLVA